MNYLPTWSALLLCTLSLWISTSSFAESNKDRIMRILDTFEPYTLSINTKLRELIPWTGLKSGICTGFLIEGTQDKVWTALHCIKEDEEVPWKMEIINGKIDMEVKKIPYEIEIEWQTWRLLCSYPEADIAIFKVDTPIRWKIAPKLAAGNVEIGTPYTSVLSNKKGGFISPVEDREFLMIYPTRIYSNGIIIWKSNWNKQRRNTGEITPTSIELLVTDNSPKWWFSWWPLLGENGELLWIWSFMDGSFGGASSIKNLETLLKRPECN